MRVKTMILESNAMLYARLFFEKKLTEHSIKMSTNQQEKLLLIYKARAIKNIMCYMETKVAESSSLVTYIPFKTEEEYHVLMRLTQEFGLKYDKPLDLPRNYLPIHLNK